MKIAHWMKREKSGLAFTTLELVQAEERQGHGVFVREPTNADGLPGDLLYGSDDLAADVECIHSQMPTTSYFNRAPKFLWCHGEPLSSVSNGVSMKAIIDMSSKVDAFIAMRPEEWSVWNTVKRTYVVPKGIDLERFKPIEVKPHDDKDPASKLSGSPAVLYVEHWRGQRNPLYPIVAMQEVWKKFPEARLHLFNCTDKKMYETFKAYIAHAKLWPFVRTLNGPVADADVNALYNRADIVVSGLFPLYARSVECFGAGKALIAAGYRDQEYPWRCDLSPESMADAIVRCWEGYDKIDYRAWACAKHDVMETVKQATAIYQRYL
jgi:glycosyltransferase involved in cell wall biosynthesis